MATKRKKSPLFSEKERIIELQKDFEKLRHKMIMEELEYKRETDKIHHEFELERERIKSAEIHKTLAYKNRIKR